MGKRNDKGQFVKGKSGNPKGRPRVGLSAAEVARKVLDVRTDGDTTRLEKLFEALYKRGLDKGGDYAARLLLEYAFGKPIQPVGGMQGTEPITIRVVEVAGDDDNG